jgi:hypothetical protein
MVSRETSTGGDEMKRVAIALVTIVAIVAATTGAAGSAGGDGPYELARAWNTPLGEVYGPVHAGPETSASYGFVAR